MFHYISASQFAKAIPEIQEGWHKFLKSSALDYREAILELARSFLWVRYLWIFLLRSSYTVVCSYCIWQSCLQRELKKCMTEDPELASKPISAADIDAIFTKEVVNPASNAVEVKI